MFSPDGCNIGFALVSDSNRHEAAIKGKKGARERR